MIGSALRIIAAAALLSACRPAAPPPLANGAYVWQRAWTSQIPASIQESRSAVAEYCVLWREIIFGRERVNLTAPAPNLDALRAVLDHASFAIRIPFAQGGLDGNAARISAVAAEISNLRRLVTKAGLRIDGIQIDYDCPTRHLRGYATFLAALKQAAPTERITPTALASWLDDPAWPALAHAADGFVLQLHDLSPPKPGETERALCDPAAARKAIVTAAAWHVPFRVALPTYSSTAYYDAAGRLAAVESEGTAHVASPNLRRVEFTSSPHAMAALVASLAKTHPQELTGLIWYRLPVAADRQNWPMSTFLAVLDGRTPESRVAWRLDPMENGAQAIVLENSGEAAGAVPERIEISTAGRNLVAHDALPPYDAIVQADSLTLVKRTGIVSSLAPGAHRRVGWLRFGSPGH